MAAPNINRLLLLFIILFAIPLTAAAQDYTIPDDEDNECLDGGLMSRPDDNGCTTEWAWTCGWYLDHWLDNGGWGNADNFFPDWCAPAVLLPPRPEPPDEARGSGGGGVIQICRSYIFLIFDVTNCLRSDQTGTGASGDPDDIDVYYRFGNYATIADCPVIPGAPVASVDDTTVFQPNFTADELFNVLGLGPRVCAYDAPSP